MDTKYYEALRRIQEARDKNTDILDLSFLYLGSIPSEIGQLANLRFLNISYNCLYQIPKEVYNLHYLVELDLSYNYLPFDSLHNLDKLSNVTFLHIEGNPAFESIPDEIKYHGLDAILNYTDDISKYYNTTTLFELKLLIVGNGEVGKTTLMKKLITNFSHEVILGQEPTTHGINIQTWGIRSIFPAIEPFFNLKAELYEKNLDIADYYSILIQEEYEDEMEDEDEKHEYLDSYNDYDEYIYFDFESSRSRKSKKSTISTIIDGYNAEEQTVKKDVKINIWGFGGQEIYHSTHQFFLTKRSIYLLVWEARKEEDYNMFDYWLNIIKYLSRNSPVIVVMNKCDVRLKDIDEFGLKKNLTILLPLLRLVV